MAPDTLTHVSEPSSTTPRIPSDALPTDAVVVREIATPSGRRASRNTWEVRGIEASTRADMAVKSSSAGVAVAVSSAKPPRSAHGRAASFFGGEGGASSGGGSSAGDGDGLEGRGAGGGGVDAEGGGAGTDAEGAGAVPEATGAAPEGEVGTAGAGEEADAGGTGGTGASPWAWARGA